MYEDKLWNRLLQNAPDGRVEAAPSGNPSVPVSGMSRRTFIELIGFSAATLTAAGCRASEEKVIPYLKQPVETTPGVATWYASTCAGCSAACGVLVKTRDGRPIKVEGNGEHPLTGGGLCAVAHAMVYELYDSARLNGPIAAGKPTDWRSVDAAITSALDGVRGRGGQVRILTPTIVGPTSREVIERFLSRFTDGRHIVYEPVSTSAIMRAQALSYGIGAMPRYRFADARMVVGFGADFLGSWISPVEYTRGYASIRDLRNGRRDLPRHIQFESRMSLTGANADERYTVSPTAQIDTMLLLARLVAVGSGLRSAVPASLSSFEPSTLPAHLRRAVESTATELLSHRGESLVVGDSNDVDMQYILAFVNSLLGNYGRTIDPGEPSFRNMGDDAAMEELVDAMGRGEVGALIVLGSNPVYDYFASAEFRNGMKNVPLTISLSSTLDETSSLCDYVCPGHHFLESWGDAEPVRGVYSLAQPTIMPLFDTRDPQESLMRWNGESGSFYDVLRESWRHRLFPLQGKDGEFDTFWDASLRDGVFLSPNRPEQVSEFDTTGLDVAVERLKGRPAGGGGKLTLLLYPSVAIGNGAHGNNPWLHELPDPVTKVTWDNYASVSPRYAALHGLTEGRMVRLKGDRGTIELPLHIQPGIDDGCVAVALGYGRTAAGRAGDGVGANAYPFVRFAAGTFRYDESQVDLTATERTVELAKTQIHDSAEGKPILNELTPGMFLEKLREGEHEKEPESIWNDYRYTEHKWGMSIDLNACTGCSACVVSCQAENNVPVVGRDEVRRRRDMSWIRIDRYYGGSDDLPTTNFEPVMCGQCDNAACESVCPVLATVHSSEGLNMQVYNRCVGTRYCANNCAYKVRRFNWFDYPHSDPIANLALNPDVTVRSRGVMEKCSFCVQRIEEVRIRARNGSRQIVDGEIMPACQQSCPARAIVFGDLTDPNSAVSRLKRESRNFVLLEELNLRPAVSYLSKVRNREEANA